MASSERYSPGRVATRIGLGDGNITRKISACAACRKQKIKCHMSEAKPPCSRCRKRGLPCTINRSLQSILEDDISFKSAVVEKLALVESSLTRIANKVGVPLGSDDQESELAFDSVGDLRPDIRKKTVPHPQSRTQQTWDVTLEGETVVPGACVVEAPSSDGTDFVQVATLGDRPADLVDKGKLTIDQAERLFDIYRFRLDPFLYNILGDHDSLQSIRAASPLLVAAVCTVATLHTDEPLCQLYQTCYDELVFLSTSQTFARDSKVDDVRGLCIGAFWLCDVSWTLVGLAVRIATGMQLHQTMHRALQGDRQSYLQSRLYFLVYVCDHQFSIAYGRPPMSRGFQDLYPPEKFLDLEHATEDDARLVSQVKIWIIGTRTFDAFGANVHFRVPEESLVQLRRLSIAIDTWRADWSDRFGPNPCVGNYPAKGVSLHFHFAKLYLQSHAFRGPPPSSEPLVLSPDMEEVANGAVLSAKAILRNIVTDPEMQTYLNGLPLYFHTMIAFAVVFLLRVIVNYHATIRVDTEDIFRLIDEAVQVLREVSSKMHGQHILGHIAAGTSKLLERSRRAVSSNLALESFATSTASMATPARGGFQADWSTIGDSWLEDYDILAMDSGLEAWGPDFTLDQSRGHPMA